MDGAIRQAKRDMTEYDSPRLFHRRRLLAFLRRNDLPSASVSQRHKTRVFSDVRLLQRLVAAGRWQESRRHLATRFLLPGRRDDDDDGSNHQTALSFIAQLHVLDDLARGRLGGAAAAEDLERQVGAITPAMAADRDYAEAIRAVFVERLHPALWEDPMDWRRVRLRASEIVGDLITEAPEFKRLLRLPRRAIHPRYAIPFGFGGRRRRPQRKTKQMQQPASLLARFFHPKEMSSAWARQGSSSERMELVGALVDEALGDGYVGIREPHLGGKSSSSNNNAATTKRLDGEDGHAAETESTAGKRQRTAGEFCITPGADEQPALPSSRMLMDPMHVFRELIEMQGVSNAMANLVLKICAHGSPERSMFLAKVLELDKVLLELRAYSMKAAVEDCEAAESCASFRPSAAPS